ncbi:MAG: hypothetical protein NPMRTH1_420001 [Nitrosopumilales archaeon]|nr:MAG: hypothetical protein NPMRTH1_420001 [Nitrosopumilales archaeon]
MEISSPSISIITVSELLESAVNVNASSSNVRVLPSSKVVVAIVPSSATKVTSIIPLITSIITLLHVTTKSSPDVNESIDAPPQTSTVAGVDPEEEVTLILTPSGFVSSVMDSVWSPNEVIVPLVVPPIPISLKSADGVVGWVSTESSMPS